MKKRIKTTYTWASCIQMQPLSLRSKYQSIPVSCPSYELLELEVSDQRQQTMLAPRSQQESMESRGKGNFEGKLRRRRRERSDGLKGCIRWLDAPCDITKGRYPRAPPFRRGRRYLTAGALPGFFCVTNSQVFNCSFSCAELIQSDLEDRDNHSLSVA